MKRAKVQDVNLAMGTVPLIKCIRPELFRVCTALYTQRYAGMAHVVARCNARMQSNELQGCGFVRIVHL
jgi:hypothetical protein